MKSLFVALQSLLLARFVAGTSFSYNNDMVCTSPASISVSSLGCGEGDSACAFGDELFAAGVLTVSESIPETACLSVKTCFMGIDFDWFCRSYDEKVSLCDYLDLMSDYTACPSSGTYAFSQNVKIPGEERSLGAGWWVTATIAVNDCTSTSTAYTTCKLSFDAVSSSSAEMYSIVSFSAVGMAALAMGIFVARKRRVARIDLRHEEQLISEGVATGSFSQMMDYGVRV